MAAAIDLLVEGGPEALTVDGVVARSGVAKTTIYRHWESRDDLVQAVFRECAPRIAAPDQQQNFDEQLRNGVDQVVAALADERWQRIFPALLRLRAQHPELAKLSKQLDTEQSAVMRSVFTRGVSEGRLPAWVNDDVDRAAMLLIGPIMTAAMIGPDLLTPEFTAQVVAQFLAGAATEVQAETN
ncbi:MAG: TetR/AcrR family transcriptional regulator [Microthrixaceae bacterium]